MVQGQVYFHPSQAVHLIVILRFAALVFTAPAVPAEDELLIGRWLLFAHQLLRNRRCIFQSLHRFVGDPKELLLVACDSLSGDQTHLLAPFLLLLPIHQLLGISPIFSSSLVNLVFQFLLQSIVRSLILRITRCFFSEICGFLDVAIQKLCDGTIQIRSQAAVHSLFGRRLSCLHLRFGSKGEGAWVFLRLFLSLSLLFFLLSEDLHAPLQKLRQVGFTQHLQIAAQLHDVFGGQRVARNGFASRCLQIESMCFDQDLRGIVGGDEVMRGNDSIVVPLFIAISILLLQLFEVLRQRGTGLLGVVSPGFL
mmetsp:Transcript_73211/g.161624  ORF Transcript_73211/g.161624 Transcript_73211/m.161624 type:complete len:309 (+) Transcript_73211:1537-2463(+)